MGGEGEFWNEQYAFVESLITNFFDCDAMFNMRVLVVPEFSFQ